jgi:hypothetical protein
MGRLIRQGLEDRQPRLRQSRIADEEQRCVHDALACGKAGNRCRRRRGLKPFGSQLTAGTGRNESQENQSRTRPDDIVRHGFVPDAGQISPK